MRQLAGPGYAALALPVIAGLPSIGLYAIVAGGRLSDITKGWQTCAVPPGVSIARAQWNPSRVDCSSAGVAYKLDLPR